MVGILLAASITFSVPEDIGTDFKAYMDYRCITNTKSPQYKLQKYAWTDEYGLRRFDVYYLVALGSYYSSTVGDCFKITLDTGESFECMVGDCKADCDTDSKHMYHPMKDGNGNIIATYYAPAPIISQTDITAGVTPLATGQSYHVYE